MTNDILETPGLSVRIKDERYKITVTVYDDGVEPPEEIKFILKFNPGDTFIYDYASELQALDASAFADEGSAAGLQYNEKLRKHLDAIFGKGAAERLSLYDNAKHDLINGVLNQITAGAEHYKLAAKAAENAAKTDALIEAKKNASTYIAPNA